MSLPLFVVTEVPADEVFPLSGDEGHHAARVQRLSPGHKLLVTDGRGARLECVVQEVIAGELTLRVHRRVLDPAPSPKLVVVQALPKGDRGELAVELMTELDVDEVVPWASARSITQWRGPRGDKALAKWRNAARAAAKQSRRTWFPVVSSLANTVEVAARIHQAAGVTLVLHEEATEGFPHWLAEQKFALENSRSGASEVMLIVGPEGGVDDRELATFVSAGARPVRFGRTILRTSSAGAAALAALAPGLNRWN